MERIDTARLKYVDELKGRLKEVLGNDAILQLAKENKIPHRIFKNPVNGELHYFFFSAEVNEWLEDNFLKYQEGFFDEKLSFIFFDKEKFSTKDYVPDELCKIKNLFTLPIHDIILPPGIYFLYKDEQLQYIGQTSNITERVLAHLKEGTKAFNKVYFIKCSINRLTEIETSLIRYYKPPLNFTKPINCTKKDTLIVESLNY